MIFSGAFLLSVAGYILFLALKREASFFAYLCLSLILFYLIDVSDLSEEDFAESEEPENPYEEGRIAMMSLDYARAERLFLRAVQADPEDMDAVYQLAVVSDKTGRKREARRWLKKYLRQKKHTKWQQDAEALVKEMEHDPADLERV